MLELADLAHMVEDLSTAPTLANMPRRTLLDKGINGPTAAHVIEEVHTPLNLAYLTFTTGSSAFQNIVGVTAAELPLRCEASARALHDCGLRAGHAMLFTYAPLVNVFAKQALVDAGLNWSFLRCSSRDALWLALAEEKPDAVVGESSFLRVALTQAMEMGLRDVFPAKLILMTAGTPLDLELLSVAKAWGYTVHDLYGCQEFGWLALDGQLLREDIELVPAPQGKGHNDYYEVVVGGIPMGDSFPLSAEGHVCNPAGRLLCYKRQRTTPEYEVVVRATPSLSRELIERTARSILRIKGRVVKVSPNLQLGAPETELYLIPSIVAGEECLPDNAAIVLRGKQTAQFEALVAAQRDYQNNAKTDMAWLKKR